MGWSIKKPLSISTPKVTVAPPKVTVAAPKVTVSPIVTDLPSITIAKEDQSLKKLGNVTGDFLASVAETMVGTVTAGDKYLLNNNLDALTGGFVGDLKNAAGTTRDLGGGKAVDDNLKSGARVAIVTGATIGSGGAAGLGALFATSGFSEKSWEEVISTAGQMFLPPDISGIVDNIVFPKPPPQAPGANYTTTYQPTSPADKFTYEDNTTVYIIIGVTTLIVLLIATKKKKH